MNANSGADMGRQTGRPVGRPPIYERAMTPAERQQRSRFMRGFFASLEKKWAGRELRRPGQWGDWVRRGPADMIGREIADACFNWESHTPNYPRWKEIAAHVRKRLIHLECEFGEFRDKPRR